MNTPLQLAMQAAITRNVPIGGASSALNVLTEWIYSATETQGVTSKQALARGTAWVG